MSAGILRSTHPSNLTGKIMEKLFGTRIPLWLRLQWNPPEENVFWGAIWISLVQLAPILNLEKHNQQSVTWHFPQCSWQSGNTNGTCQTWSTPQPIRRAVVKRQMILEGLKHPQQSPNSMHIKQQNPEQNHFCRLLFHRLWLSSCSTPVLLTFRLRHSQHRLKMPQLSHVS